LRISENGRQLEGLVERLGGFLDLSIERLGDPHARVLVAMRPTHNHNRLDETRGVRVASHGRHRHCHRQKKK